MVLSYFSCNILEVDQTKNILHIFLEISLNLQLLVKPDLIC